MSEVGEVCEAPVRDNAGWHPIETVPNNVFDVLAKYYDAGLDQFLYRRFTDCVKINESVFTRLLPEGVSMTEAGYRPVYWRDIPELPDAIKADIVRKGS